MARPSMYTWMRRDEPKPEGQDWSRTRYRASAQSAEICVSHRAAWTSAVTSSEYEAPQSSASDRKQSGSKDDKLRPENQGAAGVHDAL